MLLEVLRLSKNKEGINVRRKKMRIDKINNIWHPGLLEISTLPKKNISKIRTIDVDVSNSNIKQIQINSLEYTPQEAQLLRVFMKKAFDFKKELNLTIKTNCEISLDFYKLIDNEFRELSTQQRTNMKRQSFPSMIEKFSWMRTKITFEDGDDIENEFVSFCDYVKYSKRNKTVVFRLSDTTFLEERYIKGEKDTGLLGYIDIDVDVVHKMNFLKSNRSKVVFSKLVSKLELRERVKADYTFSEKEMMELVIPNYKNLKQNTQTRARLDYRVAIKEVMDSELLNLRLKGNLYILKP
jgi:hypothetical protein